MKDEECIDSATGQETQLAVLETTERALYTVQGIRNVLHYDVLQKEPESYGSVKKLREAGGIHRPELDGTKRKRVEYAGSYSIIQYLGSVNPYSYPCRRVRASDLWCRGWRDVRILVSAAITVFLLRPSTAAAVLPLGLALVSATLRRMMATSTQTIAISTRSVSTFSHIWTAFPIFLIFGV